MLQHFQFRTLFDEKTLPGWVFSFYYQQVKYKGIYHSDGSIDWQSKSPDETDIMNLEKHIHDLMIYHVYDQ
ncbi:YheE family protein [Lederbergia panacisoli]|uniref:YheE family protein n=1 Tax=Lederbergia panacisoli TaxID=1255251 RepID=UPI00214C1D9E|nr:YheE family protein [Lederbergia panacisoli]MCR2821089.1 YheE family protein [Lederbergia panacisoli]